MASGTEIERLFVKIEGDIAGLKATMGRATGEVDKAERAMGGKLAGLARSFTSVEGAALAVGGGVAIAGVALLKGAETAVRYADNLNDAAVALGLNVEKLQELRFAAAQNGVSQEEMDRALMKLNLSIGDAVRNGGAAQEKFDRLGISLTDAAGNTRDTDAVFSDLVGRLSQVTSAAERSSMAGDVMGDKLGPKLNQLLGVGVDGLDALRDAARKAGAVMDEAAIQKAAKAQDELDALAMVTKAQLTTALVDLAPALIAVASGIASVASGAATAATAMKAMAGASPFPLQGEIEELETEITLLKQQMDQTSDPVWLKQLQQELVGTQSLLDMTKAKQLELIEGPKAKPAQAAGAAPVDEAAARKAMEDFQARVDADDELMAQTEEHNTRRAELRKKEAEEERARMDQHRAWFDEQVAADEEQQFEIAEANAERLKGKIKLDQEGLEEYKRLRDEGMATDAEVVAFQAQLDAQRYAAARNALTNLSTLMASSSRKMFEVGKAAAIAQTIIDTYAAAQSAYKALAGIPVVGPGLGAAAAAAAVVGGLARVQAIKSTTFGSRSVAVGVGGGVAVGSSERGGGGPGGGGGGPVTYISLPSGQWFSSEFMRDFIMRLNEAQGDGARIRVVS